jgi:hypothetical protein
LEQDPNGEKWRGSKFEIITYSYNYFRTMDCQE